MATCGSCGIIGDEPLNTTNCGIHYQWCRVLDWLWRVFIEDLMVKKNILHFRYSEVNFGREFFCICVKLQLIVNINCTVGNKFIIIPAHLIFIWNHFRNSNSKTTQKTIRKSKSKVLNQIQLSLKISEKGWNRIRMTKNKTDNISDKNWTQNNLFYRQSSIIIL